MFIFRSQIHLITTQEISKTSLNTLDASTNQTSKNEDPIGKILEQELKEIGSIKSGEIMIGLSFVLLVALWFSKSPKFADGWSRYIFIPVLHGFVDSN